MDVTAFIARLRGHYVEQFRAFADEQRRSCTVGASELKIQLDEPSEVFQRLYCMDFATNDDEYKLIDFQPANILSFDPISASFGAATLSIERLRWDDVTIHHDLAVLPPDDVADWFRRWFDPDDERQVEGAELSNVIHSLVVRPGVLSTDLGTAPPEALLDMLEILEGAGATAIRISNSETATADPGS
jgi:hypothetical protein